MDIIAKRILEAGMATNLLTLIAKGDTDAVDQLPALLRQRGKDAERQLDSYASQVESLIKRSKPADLKRIAKECLPMIRILED